MAKKAKSYEVGTYQDKVGFTVTYDDGHKEHHLFAPPAAVQLGDLLAKIARAAQVTVAEDDVSVGLAKEQQPQQQGFSERIGISDHASVGLSTPEGEEDYEQGNGQKKIH